MKKINWIASALFFIALSATAQDTLPKKRNRGLGGFLEKAGQVLGTQTGGVLSQDEIARGLREALTVGIRNGSAQASAVDGYFKNPLIKILLPPDAQRVENTLRQVGLGPQVDRALLTINRGAEEAARKAVPIFVDAIRQMTLPDALNILRGEKNAATQYLKRTSTQALTDAFAPVIDSSLAKVGATRQYTALATQYNNFPLTRTKINPDLKAYVTQRAIDGLFLLVEQEEAKIRENPQARVTDLLKRVFGGNQAKTQP